MGHSPLLCLHLGAVWPRRQRPCAHLASQGIPEVRQSLTCACTVHTWCARHFAIAASMFMNSNSLPIALVQSLVATVHGLKWGKDDDKNAMFGRALTYLVVFSTLGMMVSPCPFQDCLGQAAAVHRKCRCADAYMDMSIRVFVLSRACASTSPPPPFVTC